MPNHSAYEPAGGTGAAGEPLCAADQDIRYFLTTEALRTQRKPMSEIAKTLALIAHDGKKADMVAFALSNKEVLQKL